MAAVAVVAVVGVVGRELVAVALAVDSSSSSSR